MRQRAASANGSFVQSKVQRRIVNVEFRITRAHFARFGIEQLAIKLDALRDVLYVECQMGLQGRNHRRSGGRIVLAFHREPPLESYSPKRMRPHGRQSQYICQGKCERAVESPSPFGRAWGWGLASFETFSFLLQVARTCERKERLSQFFPARPSPQPFPRREGE